MRSQNLKRTALTFSVTILLSIGLAFINISGGSSMHRQAGAAAPSGAHSFFNGRLVCGRQAGSALEVKVVTVARGKPIRTVRIGKFPLSIGPYWVTPSLQHTLWVERVAPDNRQRLNVSTVTKQGVVTRPAVAPLPDKRYLVAWSPHSSTGLFVNSIGSDSAERFYVVHAPTATVATFHRGRVISRVSALALPPPRAGFWSRDGKSIIFVTATSATHTTRGGRVRLGYLVSQVGMKGGRIFVTPLAPCSSRVVAVRVGISLQPALEEYCRNPSNDLEGLAQNAMSITVSPTGDRTVIFGSELRPANASWASPNGQLLTVAQGAVAKTVKIRRQSYDDIYSPPIWSSDETTISFLSSWDVPDWVEMDVSSRVVRRLKLDKALSGAVKLLPGNEISRRKAALDAVAGHNAGMSTYRRRGRSRRPAQ